MHLPLPLLRECNFSRARLKSFKRLGVSCHSPEEVLAAARLGCTYVTAGHIFATDCKAGLPGRGLDFLRRVCDMTELPVYAIGGVGPENIGQIKKAGVQGACLMSGFMVSGDPSGLLAELRAAVL